MSKLPKSNLFSQLSIDEPTAADCAANKNTTDSDPDDTSCISQFGVKELFQQLDGNRSGFIERTELTTAIPNADLDTINAILHKLDDDGDGKISFQELKKGFHTFINSVSVAEETNNNIVSEKPEPHSADDTMDKRQTSSSCSDLSDMTKLEEYLVSAGGDEDIYQTSRRSSTRELFNSLDSCHEAAQIYQYLLQHDPHMLQKFYIFVEETLKHIKDQHRAKEELELAFTQEQKKQQKRMAELEEEAESMSKHIEQKTVQQLQAKYEEEKLELHNRICILNEELDCMQMSEYELKQQAKSEIKDVKEQLSAVEKEHKKLAQEKREAETQLMVAKSQLVTCKQNIQHLSASNQENEWMSEYVTELARLTEQVDRLQESNRRLNETNNELNEELDTIKRRQQESFQVSNSNSVSSSLSIQLPKVFERSGPKYPGLSLCEELERASLASSFEYSTTDEKPHVHALHTDDEQVTVDVSSLDDRLPHSQLMSSDQSMSPDSIDDTNYKKQFVASCLNEERGGLLEHRRVSYGSRRRSQRSDNYNDSTDNLLSSSVSTTFTDCAPQRLYKVIFVGDAGVGKTSFISHFCRGFFQLKTSATLGIDFHTKNIEVDKIKITLQLWDTAGQERFRCISTPYFRKVDGVVLVYDCCTESSFLSVREWVETIRNNSDMEDLPIMICANKIDLRGEKEEMGFKVISSEMGEQLANECKTMFSELSAKTGEQLNSCVHRLGRIMKEREDEGIKRYEHGLQIGTSREGKKRFDRCCSN